MNASEGQSLPLSRWGHWRENWIVRRTWPSLFFVSLLTLTACVCLAVFYWWPVPLIHDEFSYLLAGETFSKGRLTNPPHPLWKHFETFGVLQQPTYMSKYPPLPGMFLALGFWIGQPIYGVWLSHMLMVAAFTWMLRQWVTPMMALLGGIYVALHGQMLMSWACGFYAGGGQLGFAASSILYGSLPTLRQRSSAWYGALVGMSIGALMLSRPYEGAVAAFPASIAIAYYWWKRKKEWGYPRIARTVAPLLGVFSLAATFQLYYNYRVTGEALTMPYQLHHRTYYRTPLFLFQKPSTPDAMHSVATIDRFDTDWQMPQYRVTKRWPQAVMSIIMKIGDYCQFYLGVCGTLIALYIFVACCCHPGAMISIIYCIFFLAIATFCLPHYAGSVVPMLIAWFTLPWNTCDISLTLRNQVTRLFILMLIEQAVWACNTYNTQHQDEQRRALSATLLRDKGIKYLVLVSYGLNHDPRNEWVYNAPDIDASRIVWARNDGLPKNRILTYYSDRKTCEVKIAN